MRNCFKKISLTFILVAFAINVFAQTTYKQISLKRDTLGSFSSRLSISTNFIDWAIMTPNIGFDIDLGNQNLIGAQSLYLNFKYRPDPKYKTAIAPNVNIGTDKPFNFWSGRVEYRWHYRWNEHRAQRRGLTRPALWIEEKFMGRQRSLEATARAMESSTLKRPEMIKGRSYVGVFAEYMDYTLRSNLDIIDRDKIKDGYALIGGISGGYEFPAFYHRNHYWQFHVGANVGAVYAPYDRYFTDKGNKVKFEASGSRILPMVTELKFGLTYRKVDISKKYWKPSNKINNSNIAENREMQALIDSIIDNYSSNTKIFIAVPKVNDDLTIKSPIGKKEVIKAIREQTKMPLAAGNFVNDTIFPIKKLDDYTITYRFKKAINKYSDEVEDFTDVTIRFRVELAGREEAEKLKQTFVDAVQKFRNEKGIPVLYAKSKPRSQNRNEIDGYLPMQEVMTLFSRIWGKTISLQQFKGVSERVGVGVLRPVPEKGLNKKARYTISLSFHPQVELNYDTDPVISQFEVQFRGEASGLAQYNKINGHRLTFQRDWKGGDTFSPEVTANEIANALKADGISNVTPDMIEVNPGQNRFRQRYSAAVYLQAAYVANVTYTVQDRGGLEKAKADMNHKVNPWVQSKQWPEIIIRGKSQDPSELEISHDKIITAFRKASDYVFQEYHFLDFCIDDEYQLMADGRYRAYARIQLHPENNSVLKIPYYIKFAQ